jgi:hypothetical protein
MTGSLFEFMDLLGDAFPTDAALFEDAKARKKAKHRESMVEFRLRKKQGQQRLVAERRRLEKEMKALVEKVNAAAASSNGADTNERQQLAVEREALRAQNLALREELTRLEKFEKFVVKASQDPMEKEESKLLSSDEEAGWRVHFDGSNTSFFFHPFSREEFDARMARFDAELTSGKLSLPGVGSFLGWEVYRAPLVASAMDSTRLMARTRVVKRLKCSLDVHMQMSYTKQKDLSPMIVAPIGWGLCHRDEASTQLLQEFDKDSLMFVHSIHSDGKHLRYLFQVRRAQWKLRDGRRKLTASLAITDSEANRQSREADVSQDEVEWATEGGIQVSITEADETSIDVVCDHWASCESARHAEYMMIQWTQLAVWWEQLTVPSNLLSE